MFLLDKSKAVYIFVCQISIDRGNLKLYSLKELKAEAFSKATLKTGIAPQFRDVSHKKGKRR